ncbi:AmpG permease [Methylophaga frappieri]|uniref:AmpG permease n=1 Tax=Methylophaga frappieri (strain ATCC BAA-2434 / DSM 25690 / JAM7) TaxID=754477 RepID=I1YK71_METFJ|nr:MFS transporter [Methylophaga frappieri]AFJ03314.1 AmpG permease [Methylophaga frappieri]
MIDRIRSWHDSLRALLTPQVLTMLFLGIAAGLPLLLIFSSLSLWLREAGIERSAVTYFSWAALGYSFKFVWAPLLDTLPLPWLHRLLGRRRSWLLVSQLAIILAIIGMGSVDPAKDSLTLMAFAAVFLGFSAATQDVVIDAYRIESAEIRLQALMSASYIAGYRIGMLLAGAGALYLASYFGSDMGAYDYAAWQQSYYLMALLMLIGVITTLLCREPHADPLKTPCRKQDSLGLLLAFVLAVSAFIGCFYLTRGWADQVGPMLMPVLQNGPLTSVLIELCRLVLAALIAVLVGRTLIRLGLVRQQVLQRSYVEPVVDFFRRHGVSAAVLLLLLVGLYRISDIVLGVIANVFYQDMGFTKPEIATVVKTFGLFMTIFGGFVGGLLAMRYGVMRILMLGAILSAMTNLLFMLLATLGHDLMMLYVVISADNLSAGIASAAFIAFLSSLTNISFTAVQYAIFSSLMTLIPKMLGGYSGGMVEAMGYPQFFLLTALLGLPVLVLIWLSGRYFKLSNNVPE